MYSLGCSVHLTLKKKKANFFFIILNYVSMSVSVHVTADEAMGVGN